MTTLHCVGAIGDRIEMKCHAQFAAALSQFEDLCFKTKDHIVMFEMLWDGGFNPQACNAAAYTMMMKGMYTATGHRRAVPVSADATFPVRVGSRFVELTEAQCEFQMINRMTPVEQLEYAVGKLTERVAELEARSK